MYAGHLGYWVSTASGTVSTGACDLYGYVIVSDGANAGTVTFRDGGASGTEQWYDSITATAGDCARVMFPHPLKFDTNLYIEVSNIDTISALTS